MTITIWEHILLFAVISLIVSLVYNALRQDDLKAAVILGLKRFIYFMIAGLILAVGTYFLVTNL